MEAERWILTNPVYGCHVWALEALAKVPLECFQAPYATSSMIERPLYALQYGGPHSDGGNADTRHAAARDDPEA